MFDKNANDKKENRAQCDAVYNKQPQGLKNNGL